MTNLETLKARIVKIVPEIMKLEFGCAIEVDFLDDDPTIILFACGKCSKHKSYRSCERYGSGDCYISNAFCVMSGYEEDCFKEYTIDPSDIKKILGRPIQLADIAKCLPKKYGMEFPYCNFLEYRAEEEGEAEYYHYIWDKNGKRIFWDRTKSLSEQSLEVIDFLLEVIPE